MKKIYWSSISLLFILLSVNSNGYSQCAPVITGPATVCVGTLVRYHAYSLPPGNLTWTINGGGTLLGGSLNPPNPQVNWTTPSETGAPWRITVTNSSCPATPTIYYVTVVGASTISAPTQITGTPSACGGSTSTYSVPPIAGLTPVWLITTVNPFGPPPPGLTPTGNQVNITWPATISSYKLFASYTNGTCSGLQISKDISVSTGTSLISIIGNGTDKFCVGESYTFTASGEQQDSYTWALTGGGMLTPNGNQATVQWTSQGPMYTLTATATSPCNATPRSGSRIIAVGPSAPSAPGVISKQNAITCVNQTERFSVTPVSGATSYYWTLTLDGGNYYDATSVPYLDRTFSTNTSGTLSVIATNGYCNSPSSPTFSFNVGIASVQASFPQAVCVGTPATFSITSTSDLSSSTFIWNVQDGEIIGPSSGSSISVRWNTTGPKTVSAHVSTPCGPFLVPGPPSLPVPTYVQGTTTMLNPITGTSQVCLDQYTYYAAAEAGTTPTWSLTLQGGGASTGGTISPSQFFTYVNWNTPGNYTLTATATNSCGSSQSRSLNVTVAAGSKPTTPPINGLTYETICTSSLPISRSYSVPFTTGYSYAWELSSSPANTLASSNNTATVTWNQTGSSNLNVTPSTTSCSGEKTYMNSTLNLSSAVGVLSSSLSPTYCGFSIPPVDLSLTSSTGYVTYQVREKGDNGAWTAWTNISSLPYTLNFSGVSASVAYYFEFQAVVQNSTCAAVYSNTVPITVYILPYINNNSASLVQEICSGTNVVIVPTATIAGSTFSWTSTVTGPIAGATTSGTGNINDVLTNTGSIMGQVNYFVTPRINGCNGPTATFTRYVYPIPVVAPGQTKSICHNQNVNYDIVVTPPGVEFNWPDPDAAGPATGAVNRTDFSGANIFDLLTNTSSTPLAVTYQVTPFYRVTSSFGCSGTTSNVIITINPKPSMTSPNTGVVCSSVPLNHILTSSVPSTYSWIAANNFNTTGESTTLQNSGIINNTIVNLASSLQTIVYDVTPTSTTGTCIGTAQTINITVNPAPVMTSSAASTICSGVTLNHPLSSNITSTFTWVAADNPNTTGESLTLQNSGAINNTIINMSVTNQIVVYTVTPTSSTGACVGTPQTVNITVKPSPGLSSSLNPPAVCSGSLFTYVPVNSVSGSTFSWSRASVSGITPSTASGTGNINETLTSTNTVPTNVAYVFSMVANGCTGSSTVTVNVKPKPIVTTLTNKTICSGESTNLPLTSDVSGTTYSWSVFSISSTISGTTSGASGTTNPIDHILTNSSTSASGSVVYRITPTATSCSGNYKDVTTTVNAKVTGGTIANSQTICQGGDPAAFIQTGASAGYGTLSYQWQSSTDIATVPFSNIIGEINSLYNAPPLMQTKYYQRITYSTQNGLTCTAKSNTLSINVNSASIAIVSANPIVCSGTTSSAITYSIASGSPDRYRIDWASGVPDVSWSLMFFDGLFYANFSSIPSTPGTYTGTLYVKNNTINCESVGYPVSVTVVATPSAIVTPASSTIFCSDQTISVQLNANTGANLIYQWIKDGTNIPGATQPSYTATQVGLYQVTVTNTLAPCFKTSLGVTVSVQTSDTILENGDLCLDGYTILTTKPGSGHLWSTGSTSRTITVYDPGTFSVNYISVFGCPVYAQVTVVRVGSNCIFARMGKDIDPEVEIEEVEEIKTLGVYPNPANDEIAAQINELAMYNLEVSVISQFGHKVGSSTIKKGENKTTIDTRNLANGVYIVVVKSARGFVIRQKILVQHR